MNESLLFYSVIDLRLRSKITVVKRVHNFEGRDNTLQYKVLLRTGPQWSEEGFLRSNFLSDEIEKQHNNV